MVPGPFPGDFLGLIYAARKQSIVRFFAGQLSTSYQRVWPADPDRYLVIITANINNTLQVGFGDVPPANSHAYLAAGQYPLVIDDLLFGEVVTYPIWISVNTATPNYNSISFSYTSDKKRWINAYIDGIISQYGAP